MHETLRVEFVGAITSFRRHDIERNVRAGESDERAVLRRRAADDRLPAP